ncbi:MAG: hypothetical protein Q4E13_14425 [Clostridia bacterium]|nr:hypothetical protein [Clostridia bacterium]
MPVGQISAYVEDAMGGAAYFIDYLARMGVRPLALQLNREGSCSTARFLAPHPERVADGLRQRGMASLVTDALALCGGMEEVCAALRVLNSEEMDVQYLYQAALPEGNCTVLCLASPDRAEGLLVARGYALWTQKRVNEYAGERTDGGHGFGSAQRPARS